MHDVRHMIGNKKVKKFMTLFISGKSLPEGSVDDPAAVYVAADDAKLTKKGKYVTRIGGLCCLFTFIYCSGQESGVRNPVDLFN